MTPAEVMEWRRAERARLIEARKKELAVARLAHAVTIARHLNAIIGAVGGKTISLYWPVQGEPDMRAWATWLRAHGAQLALPVVVGKELPLEFRVWNRNDELEKGAMDIPVPKAGNVVTPDIIIAPALGFDRRCYRLGYGGGYFDRTLATSQARAIAVAYAGAELASIHPQPHDIAFSAIVTEREVIERQN